MKKIPKQVAVRMEKVAKEVIADLKRRGHVVPVKNSNGTIQYDKYIISKNSNGAYNVISSTGKVYADDLNLLQTAAVIAHSLALGKLPDPTLITVDKNYGFREFDEELYRAAAKRSTNDIDRIIFYRTRCELAHERKNQFKSQIMKSFRKLIAIT